MKTLEQLIQEAHADLEKFKFIMADYPKRNPEKALAKQGEFAAKLATKEQHLADLQAMANKVTDAERQAEADAQQALVELEEQRLADIERARQEGYQQALEEQAKAKPAVKTK